MNETGVPKLAQMIGQMRHALDYELEAYEKFPANTTVVTKGQKRGDACSERGEQELGGYVGKTTS